MEKKYSATLVSKPFWFVEFKKAMILLSEGKSMAEIKSLSEENNIFSAISKSRAKEIYNTLSRRIQSLPDDLTSLFINEEITMQKIIALISVMNTDRLFFEFIYEVYREKIILGDDSLLDSDIRIFFNNKETQSERVAGWKDYTFKRLGGSYKTILLESGLAVPDHNQMKIVKPLLDSDLENCLKNNQMIQFIHALTGEG